MEVSQYNEKLKKITNDFEEAKKALYIEYGMSQAKFKVGDIVKDSSSIILINKITVSKGFNLPEPVYRGAELRKDLKPKVNGDRGAIFGNNNVELVKSA